MFDKQIKVIFQFNFNLSRKAYCDELNWNQMISYMITGELPESPVTYQRCSTIMYPETLKLIRTPRNYKVDKEGVLVLRYDLSAEEARQLDLAIQSHNRTLGEGEFRLKSSDMLYILGID